MRWRRRELPDFGTPVIVVFFHIFFGKSLTSYLGSEYYLAGLRAVLARSLRQLTAPLGT
jgi:hypothetical protein